MNPLIRWVGSKRSVLPSLVSLLPSELPAYYAEPFAGSAALFFGLPRRPPRMLLNDANVGLMCMYKAIQREPEALVGLLQKWAFAHSLDPKTTFEEVKTQYNECLRDDANAWHHRFDAVGAMFVYLQATSFNGVYRTNKAGAYNVPIGDVRNPRICDADHIRLLSGYLYGVDLVCGDFSHVICGASDQTFLYIDPPYDTPEAYKSFVAYSKSGFNQDAQRRLASSVVDAASRGAKFMLSNADTPLIRELYDGFDIQQLSARRSVSANGAQRGRVQELVIRNYK